MKKKATHYWSYLLVLGMVACGSNSDPQKPISTPSVIDNPTTTEVVLPTPQTTVDSAELSSEEVTAALSVVHELLNQSPSDYPIEEGYTRHEESLVTVDLPNDWLVILSTEKRLFVSDPVETNQIDAIQLTTVDLTLVSDPTQMQTIIKSELFAETSTEIGNTNTGGDQSIATATDNDSAEFGTSYLQLQRAVPVGTKVILVTGKTSVENITPFRPIFEAIIRSIQP